LLITCGEPGRAYEQAGDTGWSLDDLAREIGRQADRNIVYVDMSPAEYAAALRQAGLPDFLADFLADTDACTAQGALEDNGRVMSGLIGRPTRTLEQSVAEALPALA
jgi:NAD(P)H dehydrogenase (quinone)